MATHKDKESRGFDFPKGTLARLEEARRRHGDRSVNERVNAVVLAFLEEDERAAVLASVRSGHSLPNAEAKAKKGGSK